MIIIKYKCNRCNHVYTYYTPREDDEFVAPLTKGTCKQVDARLNRTCNGRIEFDSQHEINPEPEEAPTNEIEDMT